jgi:hypothetical protein
MKRIALFSLLLLASANGFSTSLRSSTCPLRAASSSSIVRFSTKTERISYGEEYRKSRRTVYTHEDWVKHRSPDRFLRNLGMTATSGIYRNVGREVSAVVLVAILLILWNMATIGYSDFQGMEHEAVWTHGRSPSFTIPEEAFTLPSSFLGLLLGESTVVQ